MVVWREEEVANLSVMVLCASCWSQNKFLTRTAYVNSESMSPDRVQSVTLPHSQNFSS